MNNFFRLAVAAALLLAVSSSDALARGGRGGAGGGRVGGGFGGSRAANVRTGAVDGAGKREAGPNATHRANNEHVNNAQNKAQQLSTNHGANNRPFSPAWYANHPNAWRFAHPHADAWAVASLGAATAWLGLTAASDASGVSDGETVTTADTSDDSDDSADDEAESTSDLTAATQLAASGAAVATSNAEFLPLGVFALAPKSQKEATAMVQLAVSKDGLIRGSYYDLLSDEGHAVQGAVDKKTQKVAFTVAKSKTVFETQLTDLTDPNGEVSLHFADGQASDWTLSRYDNAPFKGEVNN
jgi:hypothetical protein